MSVLHARILSQGTAGPDFHPYGTTGTPMVMPLAAVTYDGANLAYQDLHPLETGDVNAAPIPATTPGSWGQVHAAGRP
jgi:hypothetical protein